VQAVVRSPEIGWQFVRTLEEDGDFEDVFPLSEGENGEFHYTMRYRPRPQGGPAGAPPPSGAAAPGAQAMPGAPALAPSSTRAGTIASPLGRPAAPPEALP